MINIIGNAIGSKISGGAAVNEAFEFTVQTDNAGTSAADQFTIPITSTTPYNIQTSDGQTITGATGATTLTFPSAGTYTVKITESCEGWRFNGGGDRQKLLDISNWGVFQSTASGAFRGATNMTCSAVDAPINPQLILLNCFRDCVNFNGAIGNWDVSQVTQFNFSFYQASNFNQPLADWDVSNGQQFDFMFDNTAFNQPIGNWNTSSAINMQGMFTNSDFNQDINSWDVSGVTSMYAMFKNNVVFNQPLDSWNTSSVTIMQEVFSGATSFNQDISGWTIKSSGNINMRQMFQGAILFDQPIGSWNTSAVGNMLGMFSGATSFNQPLNTWNTITVTDMQQMFSGATSFNQDISSWNVSNVGRADRMFSNATSFNQDLPNWTWTNLQFQGLDYMFERAYAFNGDLSNWTFPNVTRLASTFDGVNGVMAFNNSSIANWDVSNITLLANTFRNCRNMNIDLSSWNTASLTNMNQTFFNCESFNQPLNSWDVSNVTIFSYCFYFATSFNQPLNNWNVSSSTRFNQMFFQATSFNQDIGNWNMSSAVSGDTFKEMFRNATAYDNGGQPINWVTSAGPTDISQWFYNTPAFTQSLQSINITTAVNNLNFTFNSNITTANYDATLVAWESQLQAAYPGGVGYTPPLYTWQFSGATYTLGSAAETARTSLINTYGWTITDGGGISLPFIFTVENIFNSNPLSITIPTDTATYTYNYNVSTSDGQNFTNQTGNLTINFAGVGPYDITVSGTYPSMRFGTVANTSNKIVDIKQFGSNVWQDFRDMFAYSSLSVVTATDTPNLSAVTSLKNCFLAATSYNDPKLNNWDVSTITTFETFLYNAGPVIYGSFNQDLSSWDVSNANTFYYMFDGCPVNQSFAAWDVTALGTTNPTTAGLEFISPETSQTPFMSTANYDATLISWASQAVQSGVTMHFKRAQYTLGGAAEAARNTLINTYGWSILDAGGI